MAVIFDSETLQERAATRGEMPSLIEEFGIRHLYGYRTVSLSSEYAATILIAKNGTGKTTLIGALDAFLRLQLSRLRNIDFGEIYCKLRGVKEEIKLTHDELMSFLNFPRDSSLCKVASRLGVTPEALFEFILSDYRTKIRDYYLEDSKEIAAKFIESYNFDTAQVFKVCADLFDDVFSQSSNLRNIKTTITRVLEGYEVVYLPTYRRVELSLTDEVESRRGRRRRTPKFSVASGSLHVGEIQFGLSDISDRLAEINRSIIVQSNNGYRKISENIISDLINGYDIPDRTAIPVPEDLKLFFDRMEKSGRDYGPYYPISTPDFARIYSGEGVPEDSRKFLTYFLGKLNEIVELTKQIERPVDEFVLSCNKYLSSTEPSTEIGDSEKSPVLGTIDNKVLKLDRTKLSVYVESVPYGRPVSLDALSSGEKQMISLLAKLYLYPKRKIVLIDEPELSLSIDWQRGILVDVLLADQCEQVIAITHSPFVFDNSLEPFAKSLTLQIEKGINVNFDPREFDFGLTSKDEF